MQYFHNMLRGAPKVKRLDNHRYGDLHFEDTNSLLGRHIEHAPLALRSGSCRKERYAGGTRFATFLEALLGMLTAHPGDGRGGSTQAGLPPANEPQLHAEAYWDLLTAERSQG